MNNISKNTRAPKARKFSAAEEATYSRAERLLRRSDLLTKGAAAMLNITDYYADDLPVVIEGLQEAAALREEAMSLHRKVKGHDKL